MSHAACLHLVTRAGVLGQGSNAALITFVIYIMAVFGLAWLSNRLLREKQFLSEYFLGSRNLGVWAFALTFAATSASGGSFTGFPSKIYSHGWILGLWIGSYMVFPICTMGLLGKRLNQIARISGAITVPDVVRDRFRSRSLGLIAVSLIVFFLSFNLVAQFKSGSEILKTLVQDVPTFQTASAHVADWKAPIGWLQDVDAGYLVCLLAFAAAVIAYTTYGGFHAVVWTDVMQGIVMVFGVVLMLPLALWLVGGLDAATDRMAEMTPPRLGLASVRFDAPASDTVSIASPWFALPAFTGNETDPDAAAGEASTCRLFRVNGMLSVSEGAERVDYVRIVEITTPHEIARQLERLVETGQLASIASLGEELDSRGFAWLDTRKTSVFGTVASVDITWLRGYPFGEGREGVYVTGPGPKPPLLPKAPGMIRIESQAPYRLRLYTSDGRLERETPDAGDVTWVAAEEGAYDVELRQEGRTTGTERIRIRPGETVAWTPDDWEPLDESNDEAVAEELVQSLGFLPLSLAISFFCMWAISGTGQPQNMVRLMAFRDASTLRRSIFTVAIYYSFIYFPLVIIFCCARLILPGMDLESDRIMPQMAVTLTAAIEQPWLAGLLVAAPFAAVMSTVDSFLLVMSSAMVRDVYQRNINPNVSERTIKWMSYTFTLLLGTGAMLGAVNPPQFLQDIIVYTGSGLAACFLAPVIFALYWPRVNTAGCLAGMLLGFGAHLSMYLTGWVVNGSFYEPYQLANLDPIIIGLTASFSSVIVVTLITPPPPRDLVQKYFYRRAR